MIKKLEGIPSIYYLNLDSEIERREYMESQFEKWELKNVKRFSGSQYLAKNYNDWKNIVHFNDIVPDRNHFHLKISIVISTLDMIRYWLETTNEQYLILMEDDYDLNLIEYWHFDWEYLMNNIPYDWDCIQMSFENGTVYPCYLHPIISGHGTGGSLINRRYAEKLMSLLYKDGKFDLSKKRCNSKFLGDSNIATDYLTGHSGKTYCIPLFAVNPWIGSYAKNILRPNRGDLLFSYKACKKWWTKLRDVYTLEEFFTYGKWNDKAITSKNLDD